MPSESRKGKGAARGLDAYRAKRSLDTTSEPGGGAQAARPRVFCVQKHAARQTHYDLRLEWNGVLLSWAVPKGPSANVNVNRFAVQTEDHPVEYADFEGVIPEGNYGAGAMIVWDKGLWVPIDPVEDALEKGVLHFDLHGYKLHGGWVVVRTSKEPGGNEWLLRKRPDAHARQDDEGAPGEESIFSGLTVEELGAGATHAQEVRARLDDLGATRRTVDPEKVAFMHAETTEHPFTDPGWLFELKYDGYRVLACRRSGGQPYLRSRNGHDITRTFPEIARALRGLPYENLILDAELVVLDESGRTSFDALQRRSQIQRRMDAERASISNPCALQVFDLLGFEGFDLRGLPLRERKTLLRALLPKAGPLRYTDHVDQHGEAMFEKIKDMGLEGLVAKEADAIYRGGRSGRWLKLVAAKTDDFVICGWSPPKGSRAGFGALHVGAYRGDRLVYAGRVGSGFSEKQLDEIHATLLPDEVDAPPCEGPVPTGKTHHWVTPRYVAEVKYKTWTDQDLLRHPVFMRFRDDKPVTECLFPGGDAPEPPPPPKAMEAESAHPARTLSLTNLDKLFWPEEKITKGNLIDYYRSVSEWLLPFLVDRPLVLTRYPDGIEGKSFYQKNAPDFVPDWVRTESIWSEHTQKEIDYFVCDDEDMLVYVINSGAIPLHVWSSRVSTLGNPDWCILDLDPKGAPFEHVVTLAKAIRKLCDEIGLETFVKTSGSSGLHVLVPLGRLCTYEQSRMLGQLISRLIESDHRDIATTQRVLDRREGKVYLDFLQNRHGQLLVAPYSVRPLPGAPVSAPLAWREVTGKLTPRKFTVANLPPRMRRKKDDPFRAILDATPDLVGALARLAERME